MYFDSINGEHSYSNPDITVSQSVEVLDDSLQQTPSQSTIQTINLSDLITAASVAETINGNTEVNVMKQLF